MTGSGLEVLERDASDRFALEVLERNASDRFRAGGAASERKRQLPDWQMSTKDEQELAS